MPKTLIVAEKPSVARELARALSVPARERFFESGEIVITNCIGHLVELVVPEAEDRNIRPPIIPEKFSLVPIARTADQYQLVQSLMNRPDIDVIVNACDAGREGEAIFRLTYELSRCKKPMQRMWLQSMTQAGMLAAWNRRKPGAEYNNLAAAARCRAEADWLFGINGSRAVRAAVGRVMTPTLGLVVKAYRANKEFVPKAFYEVVGTFGAQAGEYVGKWIPSDAVGDKDGEEEDRSSRFDDRARAAEIVARCGRSDPSSVVDNAVPVRSACPSLYDLTTLQREANNLFKFSASKTLDIAQALYEKHKVTSYPRTDSRALPEDYPPKCSAIVGMLGRLDEYRPHCERIQQGNYIQPSHRVFDDSKISDHFAVIPTGAVASGLSADEAKIYRLIVQRFLAVFHPDAEFSKTTRITTVEHERFRSVGTVMLKPGWRVVYGEGESKPGALAEDDKGKRSQNVVLVRVAAGEPVRTVKIEVKSGKTTAPKLLTEATLLAAMASAGKFVDDGDLAEAMSERGLGTQATRAATIEKLLDAKAHKGSAKTPFMVRQKNFLEPTQKGLDVVAYLQSTYPRLVNVEMTGELEYQLKMVEEGKVKRADFMRATESAIVEMVSVICGTGSDGTSQASEVRQ